MKERRDGTENGVQHSCQYGRCTQWRREAERRRQHTGKHTKHTAALQELGSRGAIEEYSRTATAAERTTASPKEMEKKGEEQKASVFFLKKSLRNPQTI